MNAKLGGVNHAVAAEGRVAGLPVLHACPTIVLGIDVSHPAPGSDAPSVAAVTASLDADATRYAVRLWTQSGKQEMLDPVQYQKALKELFLEFYKQTKGYKPMRVLIFRDGVADNQFDAVIRDELMPLVAMCAELEAGCPR